MFNFKCSMLLLILSFSEAQFYRSPTTPCGVLRLAHGKVRFRAKGSFARFSCLGRYTLIGNRYSTCRNGRWDVPLPVCIRPGCPALPEVKNAVNMTMHENAWVMFFCMPGYDFFGSPVVYCDGTQWNATVPQCIDSSAAVQTECDFEKPDICGWRSDELHDFDWRRWNRATPSSFLNTGPRYDHTYGKFGNGYYMYIESSGPDVNDTARLISPVYSSELAINGCFIFNYHMFGRSMGGLRIYQKPDKVLMSEMIKNAKNYTLYEIWGNHGDQWYENVTMLRNYSDDFQIVIEGIRGNTYLSDMAIDDVSIQHGENCTDAYNRAHNVAPNVVESCAGRCDLLPLLTTPLSCGCSIICIIDENCCPDYFDLCESSFFNGSRTNEDDASSTTEVLPQTQKLIATTTETLPTSTSSSTITSSTTTTPSTTSTVRSTTSTTTSTTITSTTTTRRPTTKVTRPTTKATTIRRRITSTTKRPTTSPTSTTSTTTTTTRRPTTTVIPTTKTTLPSTSTTTFVPPKTTKHEKLIAVTKAALQTNKQADKKSSGMSDSSIAVTVILVCGLLFGAAWLAIYLAHSRGVVALARLRGRAASDNEVRYLRTDVDDD